MKRGDSMATGSNKPKPALPADIPDDYFRFHLPHTPTEYAAD